MPNAIGQRRHALPEKSPDGSRLRTILPKQIVEKDYRRGHLPDLAGFLIERAFRGRDQQPQHECGERAHQARRHFHDFPGVGVHMLLQQQRPDCHPGEGTAEHQHEHKERDRQSIHEVSPRFSVGPLRGSAPRPLLGGADRV